MGFVGVLGETLQVLEGVPVHEELSPEEALLPVLVQLFEHQARGLSDLSAQAEWARAKLLR